MAIEIQGLQHNEEVRYFAKQKGLSPSTYLEQIKYVDEVKKRKCLEQGVIYVEITDGMDNESVLDEVKKHLPIKSNATYVETPLIKSKKLDIINKLREIQCNTDGYVKKSDIVAYSRALYDDLRDVFGGIYDARKAANIKQP